MDLLSADIWPVLIIGADLVLGLLIIFLLTNFKGGVRKEISVKAAEDVMKMLEPLLEDMGKAAKGFEIQLSRKKELIFRLNEDLDKRIISLNLLLNRSEINLGGDLTGFKEDRQNVCDQQEAISELYNSGEDAESIARKLSMPMGEVNLVLDLKRKLMEME